MRHHDQDAQTFERTLYAAPTPPREDDEPREVVRFGGFPFVRTVAGEWRLVPPANDRD